MSSTRGRLGPGRSVALLMVVALGACGQPAGTDTSGGQGVSETAATTTGSTSTTSTSPSSSSSKGGGNKEEPEALAWVPFGPADPDIPTPTWPLYRALADGRCSELRQALPANDAGDFGRAMAALCAAAVEGKDDQWAALEQLRDADPSRLGNDCVSPIVSDLIKRALDWHDRYPGHSPRISFHRLSGRTDCGERANNNNQGGSGEETGGSTSGTTSGTTTGSPSGVQSSPETAS